MGNELVRSCDTAPKDLRFANWILDVIFVNILGFILACAVLFVIVFFASMLGTAHPAIPVFQALLLSLPVRLAIGYFTTFAYYFLCEALWQRTLGKLITGTKVVTLDGTKPTFGVIGVRTLCRLIPFVEPFSFLTRHPGGWHDWWSGTVVVRTQPAQAGIPQPVSLPAANVGSGVCNAGIPAYEPIVQRMSAPEPTSTTVAASKAPRVPGTVLGVKTTWFAAVGAATIVLGGLMIWSANRPVKPASASDIFDQAEPVQVAPAASSVSIPPSALPTSVSPSAFSAPVAPSAPAPTPAPAPSGLPSTIQVDAVVVVNGKIVGYSDIGELAEGRTVSGWKVVRVTGREMVLKSGDAVHTYPLSKPGTDSE